MNVLGITASFNMLWENNNTLGNAFGLGHDSAAALIIDGHVVAAVEEERLNRIKHSNKAPIEAMRFCLKEGGLTLPDIDAIAFNFNERTCNLNFLNMSLEYPERNVEKNVWYYIHRLFQEAFHLDVDDKIIHFVPHHIAHAESAFALSGFDRSLVCVLDGMGDDGAGIIQLRGGEQEITISSIPIENSLGLLYIEVIKFLGYKVHDEFKVMGLAPYGNPNKYRRYFNKIVQLLPNGQYRINPMYSLLFDLATPRKKGEPFSQAHKDIASSLQKVLEDTCLHILKHYREETQAKNLCLAGGVAHNCSLNGKIMESSLFERIYVQPAAHDAGSALGAALRVHNELDEFHKISPMTHVFLGPDILEYIVIKELDKWCDYLDYTKPLSITQVASKLLAEGKVIGWVQGRSEFGPRALGNRSILADPRPSENKERINRLVKKREGYRPFAPAIQEEWLAEYYHLGACEANYSFMNMVLHVQEAKRGMLGAVTHIDGTARIQAVSNKTNPLFWNLIEEFRKITGLPIVLNTSFNNHAEPIVDSAYDAISCFLTTEIDYLVIGDYLITKKRIAQEADLIINLFPQLCNNVQLCKKVQPLLSGCTTTQYYLAKNNDEHYFLPLKQELYHFLNQADGQTTVGAIMDKLKIENTVLFYSQVMALWDNRVIRMMATKDTEEGTL